MNKQIEVDHRSSIDELLEWAMVSGHNDLYSAIKMHMYRDVPLNEAMQGLVIFLINKNTDLQKILIDAIRNQPARPIAIAQEKGEC